MASAAYMRIWRANNLERSRELSREAGARFREKHPVRWAEIVVAAEKKREHPPCPKCGDPMADPRSRLCLTCSYKARGIVRRFFCSVCGDKHFAHGYCRHHYNTHYRERLVGLDAVTFNGEKRGGADPKEINLWQPASFVKPSFSDDFKQRVLAKYDTKVIDGGSF